MKVLLEFRYVYFNDPFGFHLPPREVVHANIFKSTVKHMQTRYFLSSYHKSLGYLKILEGRQLNFVSFTTEAAQEYRDEVDIKEAKSFG